MRQGVQVDWIDRDREAQERAGEVPVVPDSAQEGARGLMLGALAMGASPGEALGFAVAAFGREAMTSAFQDMARRLECFDDFRSLLDGVALTSPKAAADWLVSPFTAGIVGNMRESFSFFLVGRAWVEALPDGFRPSFIAVDDCVNLTRLPSFPGAFQDGQGTGLRVVSLSANGCTSLARLPDQVDIDKTLSLKGCTALHELPRGVRVHGSLSLTGSGIRSLPTRLMVGGDLWLFNCREWDGVIPDDAQVLGEVFTDDYPKGVRLDRWRADRGQA